MGTVIEAVSVSRPRRRLRGTGAIVLADEAARACLENAGRTASELDVLINAGVYHDNNLYEPALASIIQEDIGANPAPTTRGGHGTFSFDVNNGACGALTAMHLVDGFLASGTIDLGVVVTSDADPGRGSNWDFPFGLVGTAGRVSREDNRAPFPYSAVGGAVLMARSADPARGFSRFAFATFPEYAHLMEASVSWEGGPVPPAVADRVPGLEAGTNVLRIRARDGYGARCAECAERAARSFLDGAGLSAADIDVLVPSPAPLVFPDLLGQALGITADRVARVDAGYGRVHTAGPLVALDSAMRRGQLAGARNVLIACAGAGITVALALYHP